MKSHCTLTFRNQIQKNFDSCNLYNTYRTNAVLVLSSRVWSRQTNFDLYFLGDTRNLRCWIKRLIDVTNKSNIVETRILSIKRNFDNTIFILFKLCISIVSLITTLNSHLKNFYQYYEFLIFIEQSTNRLKLRQRGILYLTVVAPCFIEILS